MKSFFTFITIAMLAASTLALAQSPPDGRGVQTYPNGSRYEGEFKDGKRNGMGIVTFADGTRYEGEFKSNQFDGHGIYTYTNGKRYVGEFKDGHMNGRGIKTSPNGDRYEGEFKEDKFQGRGVFTFANGDRYEGEFKNDLRDGRGIYRFASGSRYDGEYKDDKRTGRGVYTYASGARYEGDYLNNERHGRGVYTFPSGSRAEGEFRDGKQNGHGVLTLANGNREEGEFRDDKLFNGRTIDSGGKVLAVFVNGSQSGPPSSLASANPNPVAAAGSPGESTLPQATAAASPAGPAGAAGQASREPAAAAPASPAAAALPAGALPWPQITRADLGACRSEIAEFHRREIAYFRKEAADERNARDVSERNIKIYLEAAANSAKLDDFSWFMKGNYQCEASSYPCFGPGMLDLSHDTAAQWKEWSDAIRGAAQREPDRGPELWDYGTVVDRCINKVWVAKLDAELKLASAKGSGNPAPASASTTRPSALTAQQVATCSEDIRRTQLESQSWPGNANDVAVRLGKFQKELFEGRCAGHPEAKAYLAGANRMLGYAQTATAGAAASTGGNRPLAKRETKSVEHNPVHVANSCIKIYFPAEMKALGLHDVLSSKMVNTCGYPVSVQWCVQSGADGGDCKRGYGNSANLAAASCLQGSGCTSSYGVDAADGERVRFAACRYNPDRGWGFQPVEQNPRNPFQFSCG